METSESLASQLQELRLQLDEKNARLKELEEQLQCQPAAQPIQSQVHGAPETFSPERPHYPLLAAEYQRYGRQMILPEIGLQGEFPPLVPYQLTSTGQLKLKSAKVLIVGLGGLGCPSAAYLAGAGI